MSFVSPPSPLTVFRSRRVVTPQGVEAATVWVSGGAIEKVASYDAKIPAECHVEELHERVLSPGLVDLHVHINEPGRTEWEGFETGTRAAAAGGVTTFVEMPLNASPVVTSVAALEQKIAAASPKLRVDSGFYGGLVPGNLSEIEPLLDAGVFGLKAFMVHSGLDEFPAATEADLRAAMPRLAKRGALLLAHAELDGLVPALPSPLRRYTDYMNSRPPEWELSAIRLLIELCRETGCRTHIVHLATAEALPLLKAARDEGLPITVETCPHYLYFEASQVADGDTRFKCAPPIRDAANREGLWEGLREGIIDTIGSDHSPCPPELKQLETGDFAKAWGGISSLQWTLSTIWTGAQARGFSIADVVRWTCTVPAHLIGREAAIAPGGKANFVAWEPEETFSVTPENNYHRHKLTPYAGHTLFGRVHATYLRGEKIYADGEFLSELKGHVIFSHDE